MPHVENDHIVETPTEARAGATGHNVRYVLTIATAAVVFRPPSATCRAIGR